MWNIFSVPLVRAVQMVLLFCLSQRVFVEGSIDISATTTSSYGGCVDGITCQNVSANTLEFQCRFASPPIGETSRGNVMMLHGFPEWSDMFIPLMKVLATHGFKSVACNQRAYSIGARPTAETAYSYEVLRTDVFAIASAVNFSTSGCGFHLVGHDHGAALGWLAASAHSPQSTQLLSYSSLSIPHLDAFNAGLNKGVNGDVQQQIASQYFTMFVLANSSTLHGDFWYNMIGKNSGDVNSGSFATPNAFQKALWWYNGARDSGTFSMPPLMSAAMLLEHGAVATAGLRTLFGGVPDDGHPATLILGNITIPTLFVCGNNDTAILCTRPYALKTRDYVSATYAYLEVDCGHQVLACENKNETDKVISAIVNNIVSATLT